MKKCEQKILIVDDKGINRYMLGEIFRDDFAICEAKGGKEAIDILSRFMDYSCVLLDIIMPGIDGFGVLDYLQEHDMLKAIPIIIVTDDGSEDTSKRAYEYDVADMVIKPFEPRIIKRRVENIIELYAYRNKERQ